MKHNSCQLHQHIDDQSRVYLLKFVLLAGCIMLGAIYACYGLEFLLDSAIIVASAV